MEFLEIKNGGKQIIYPACQGLQAYILQAYKPLGKTVWVILVKN